jgi:Na+/H+ antiporter NhaD/arsenite permease-like protein
MKSVLIWLYGLISAAISAAANTITVMIVAPETFNVNEGLSKVLTVAGVSALVGAADVSVKQ